MGVNLLGNGVYSDIEGEIERRTYDGANPVWLGVLIVGYNILIHRVYGIFQGCKDISIYNGTYPMLASHPPK